MSEIDELDINPFFIALQSKYLSCYEKAQEERNLICLPQSDCLHGVRITDKFVETHILKPSPFFQGQYRTLRSDKQIVTIEDDGDYIYCQEGFPTKTKIKIICEELGYNKEYKPYKMLIIARPLDHNVLRQSKMETTSSSGEFNLKCSLKDCRDYLKSIPEFSKPMKELDEQIQKFMKSYIILKDYLLEAALRLETMATTTFDKCIKSVKDRKLTDQKFKDIVTAAVET
ncbi:putative uncharacterized protein DDB_G0284213 [Ruditapes philippinarum]|uniref:putative uncharacterized protein DDB_G0284213 n=1 Tax=Ruditapes philippinarum TaxID=129788 RepID=UPI00295B8179|nr:putative uncharacterized protein DDB_G0284213 [Ruditapes philippinarum]